MNKLYFALLVALSHCGIGANFDADALFQAFQQEVADGVKAMTAKIAAMDLENQKIAEMDSQSEVPHPEAPRPKVDRMKDTAEKHYNAVVELQAQLAQLGEQEEDENDQQLKLRQSLNSRYAFLRRKLGVLLRQHPRLRKDYSITT